MKPLRLALLAILLAGAACDSGPADTTMPSVRLIFPPEGAVLAPGVYTLVAVATDDRAVTDVVFWQDSVMLAFIPGGKSDTFRCGWDCTGEAAGPHWIAAEAIDRAHNDTSDVTQVYLNR